MNFTPPKLLGLTLGVLLLALLLSAIGLSIARLGQAAISPQSLIWIAVLLLTVPLALLALNRLVGVATARYRLDRDGFYVQWGTAYEQIPIGSIQEIDAEAANAEVRRPAFGFWWPGNKVGQSRTDELGLIEFFATTGPIILVRTDSGKSIAITPTDREAFVAGFNNALRMGALEGIPARSDRPEQLLVDIWSDSLARLEILAGLTITLLLLGGLVIGAPALPDLVPFGFGADGEPGPLVPPGRLILLPIIGGLIWLADTLLGSWFYRTHRDRPAAYVLWGTSVLSGLLLAGAALHLISQ